jgi:hypothetical protein
MGIYLSWRGKILTPSWANQALTFPNRFDTARTIGNAGPLREFLVRLAKVKQDAPERTRRMLVLSGHSLGARALYYALEQNDIVDPLRASSAVCSVPGAVSAASDLILLRNPVISVREFSEVNRLATTTAAAPDAPPNLVIAAAANDPVTRIAYRLFRASRFQFAEDYSTIGNWPPYFTHALNGTGELPKPVVERQTCRCPQIAAESLRNEWDTSPYLRSDRQAEIPFDTD